VTKGWETLEELAPVSFEEFESVLTAALDERVFSPASEGGKVRRSGRFGQDRDSSRRVVPMTSEWSIASSDPPFGYFLRKPSDAASMDAGSLAGMARSSSLNSPTMRVTSSLATAR